MELTALTVPVVLLAGVVSFASPCFLPLAPVFIGYLTGQSAGQRGRRWFGLAQAGVFMTAFGLVFTALWALVYLIGWLNRDGLRIGGGVVLVLLGLHTAGLVRLPWLDRNLKPDYRPDHTAPPNWRRSALLGLAFGAGWTPCVGPILGAVLGLTASASSPARGLGLLLVYIAGLGLPFVALCGGATSLTARLGWFVRHHRGVSRATGGMLVAVGFLMMANLFPRLAGLVPLGW
ncbi:MAG: cytochrome c biogenesis CcdA family protein [Propionibacteriaceae bacterium]|jgi:cytochrome c-type biogenesis protein|nr:cytochrome c biogenesis CcdA family protein [Propionibacteriaceae bacterium]